MGLYPTFLDVGYGPKLFWSLSIAEVEDLLESYERRQEIESKKREAELRDLIVIKTTQAEQIAILVARFMGADVPIKPLEQYYPNLFQEKLEEETEEEKEQRIETDVAIHKARMEEYAFRHNLAMKRGEEK